MIAILILVSIFVIILLFKILPNEKVKKNDCDWNNKIARRVICLIISSVCVLSVYITGKEIFNIISDIKEEAFVYCVGSYTSFRNEMTVETVDGNIIKLQPLHSILDEYESEYAEIVYSEKSHILLSCSSIDN